MKLVVKFMLVVACMVAVHLAAIAAQADGSRRARVRDAAAAERVVGAAPAAAAAVDLEAVDPGSSTEDRASLELTQAEAYNHSTSRGAAEIAECDKTLFGAPAADVRRRAYDFRPGVTRTPGDRAGG